MDSIHDYQIIAKLYESSNSLIYRAILPANNKSVILKILKGDYPSPSELARYRQEYEITRSLKAETIIQVYDLQRYQNSLVMLIEDFGGESLKILLSRKKITPEEFLCLAIKITEGLIFIHSHNLIHKDINSSNIIVNLETQQIKIIDFGISTRLVRENLIVHNPNQLEGTLSYISPEQTGRMNRGIDYRSDFYSLGVTFYELLTHRLPFESGDPMELVHCHIAQQPTAPQQLVSTIPIMVSDIVMKLLAKAPEERYQSARGIKADLEICLQQLKSEKNISQFTLGRKDFCDRFQIPEKLYGREKEIIQLLTTFERVSQSHTEMILVFGFSGIGKSALVNEVQKPIVSQRGYFISGKFDQLKRDIPYAAFSQAFQDLIQQLLTESETVLQTWKEKIIEALGTNSQVIIDVIPGLEKIIGKQPSVPQLEPAEAQNKFNFFFPRFINIFSTQSHPLVIFLDDLQWADLPSLKLIELLMTDSDIKHLLLIGAYRDNEVSSVHPLIQTLDRINKLEGKINKITLCPLAINHINQLIKETLNCSTKSSQPLAELLNDKTKGNPFFLNQLLQSLYKNGFLRFDRDETCWKWNIEEIKDIGITDNVIDLMIDKIKKLDEDTQKILKLAACIGNRFDLEILSGVHSKSQAATSRELQLALQEGLILPLSTDYKIPLLWHHEEVYFSAGTSNSALEKSRSFVSEYPKSITYRFLHDRVQQAAYTLIPENEKKHIHLKAANLLLENTPKTELEEKIFNIVNQFNEGIELVSEQSEKNNIALLNLKAGKRAKASAAYEPAFKYLEIALKLLDSSSWNSCYDLTLDIYVETIEVSYLITKFKKVEELSEIVVNKTKNVVDKIKVYQVQIRSYFADNYQYNKSIEIAIKALEELGIQVPKTDDIQRSILEERKSLQFLLRNKKIEDLIELPKLSDPYKIGAIKIFQQIISSLNTINSPLITWVLLNQVNLCIKYGNSPEASSAYAFYGLMQHESTRNIDIEYKFGKLAIHLLQKYNNPKTLAKVVHMFYGFTWHWKKFLRNPIAQDQTVKGFQEGINTGDNEYASYSIISYCLIKFFGGYDLEEVTQECQKYSKAIEKLKLEYAINYIKICQNMAKNFLRNEGYDCLIISEDTERDRDYIEDWTQSNAEWLLFISYLSKTIFFYFLKKSEKAFLNGLKAREYIATCKTYIPAPHNTFYTSLALLGNYNNCTIKQQQNLLDIVEQNQREMKEWILHCPENFQHKYELVAGEKARVLGNYWEAQELYEKAIQGAKKYEFIHEEAIAYERAAEFYFSLDRQEIGNLYLRNAHHCYSRWGAKAKVRQLEDEYPQLLVKTAPPKSKISSDTISTTGSDTSESLDLNTVIKASQALAGEIQLDKLLEKLMTIAIENAGAQKGLLILKRDNNWVIEAQRTLNSQETTTLQSIPIHSPNSNQPLLLSPAIANYVIHSKETVLLNDAVNEGKYIRDPYIVANQPKSILCTPLINQGKLSGILYLENNLTTNAFTSDRVELLRTLSTQAAISIENARLYQRLEDYNQTLEQQVAERTEQLQHKNEELAQTLEELQTTQNELIQSEKMAALGQLVAGIAHEINTPLGAIRAAIGNTDKALQASLSQIPQLLPQLNPQQQTDFFSFLEQSLQSQPGLSTREKRQIKRTVTQKLQSHNIANAQQLAHLLTEGGLHENVESQLSLLQTPQAYQIVQTAYDIARLHANSQTINNAVERAAKIVFALKSYARYDHSGEKQSFQITDGIETVLELYQNYLNKGVKVVRRYQPVPEIPGYPDELVQVWTNLIHNAIQAMEGKGILEIGVRQQERDLVVEVTDSGCGIPPEIEDKIFQPFFTTKPTGEGSGLGLDIVRKIIEKHQGTITFSSVPGHTTFTVVLPKQ